MFFKRRLCSLIMFCNFLHEMKDMFFDDVSDGRLQ